MKYVIIILLIKLKLNSIKKFDLTFVEQTYLFAKN